MWHQFMIFVSFFIVIEICSMTWENHVYKKGDMVEGSGPGTQGSEDHVREYIHGF